MPMIRTGTPIGTPWPTASALAVVMRTVSVAVAVAGLDKVSVPPETEATVVLAGMSVPVIASGEATVEGNVPVMVAVVEPLVKDTPWTSRFGPRLVSVPQSLIRVGDAGAAHQSR